MFIGWSCTSSIRIGPDGGTSNPFIITPTNTPYSSPAKLKLLLEELKHHPNLSYHALNAKGEEYTNNAAAGQGRVNAVTWGVFPGREIVQPTVVDSQSFGIWKVSQHTSEPTCEGFVVALMGLVDII